MIPRNNKLLSMKLLILKDNRRCKNPTIYKSIRGFVIKDVTSNKTFTEATKIINNSVSSQTIIDGVVHYVPN